MKKKVLLCSYNLDIGGIETSLVNLLNKIDLNKYEITLLLEKKEGIFLKSIPKDIKVIEYKTSDCKNIIFRKIINRLKLIFYILKFYKKFDFTGCYATHLGPEAIITRYASTNNALWVHSNYYYVYKKDINKMKEFFDKRKVSKFNKILFVSNESKEDFINIYKTLKNKCFVLSNIIDYKKIISLSNEKISEKIKKPLIVFVGRLDEESKRISLLIESLSHFDNYECLIIGDGPDKNLYEKLIEEKKLRNKIKLLGKKDNPYPYIKNSDLVILTSLYEGFPVVLVEAMILSKPFISTFTSSNKYFDLKDYGNIVDNNIESVTEALKEFFEKGIKVKNKFDFEEFEKNILLDLEELIEKRSN
ncbi:MAG: glycosyltransferase [Bacilli bacterium]|nr:glycosyltransferase [Bacilli bacterium]